MTFVQFKRDSPTTYLFTHSLVFACLWQKKIVSFLYIYEQKPNEGRRVLNPHTDWDDERWMKKMVSLSFSLYFSFSLLLDILLRLLFSYSFPSIVLPIGDHHRVPSASRKILFLIFRFAFIPKSTIEQEIEFKYIYDDLLFLITSSSINEKKTVCHYILSRSK